MTDTVTQAVKPILVEIVLVLVEVMDDFVHGHILAYKRIFARLTAFTFILATKIKKKPICCFL